MTRIILWATVAWIPLLMYYMNINEAKFKKNIALGVTFPKEGQTDEGVLKIISDYKKEMAAVCAGLVAAAVILMFIPMKSMMAVYMLWIDAAILLPFIPYVSANRKLKEYKAEKGWISEKHVVTVDTQALGQIRFPEPWKFVPPVIVSLIPAFFDPQGAFIYIMFALFCTLFGFSCRFLFRRKAEMVDANTELTQVLTRIRSANWGKLWLLTSWFMSASSIACFMAVRKPVISFVFMGVITAAVCWAAIHMEMKTRRLQEKLTAGSGTDWYVDEDDHWLFGILYSNPSDERLIVNNRIGLNSTVNIAKPAGKVLMALVVILFAAMPLFGVWMDRADAKPIVLKEENGIVSAASGFSEKKVQTEEIVSVELLEELPSNMSRRMGSAMEHLIEGSFTSEIGALTVQADPTVSPFILIETKDGKKYLFNTRDPSETRDFYENLLEITE